VVKEARHGTPRIVHAGLAAPCFADFGCSFGGGNLFEIGELCGVSARRRGTTSGVWARQGDSAPSRWG